MCGNETHEKETKHIHTSAVGKEILIGNLDWCKRRHCKNKAREIDCPCCSEVQCLLLWLKSWSVREASHHPAFMCISAQLLVTCVLSN